MQIRTSKYIFVSIVSGVVGSVLGLYFSGMDINYGVSVLVIIFPYLILLYLDNRSKYDKLVSGILYLAISTGIFIGSVITIILLLFKNLGATETF